LIWERFTPFTEENVNYTNQPTPQGCSGVWVTLIGNGGRGANGAAGIGADRWGGGGGGGAAVIGRSFIPASYLDTTYSVTRGASNGAASVFSSGSVVLTANGGKTSTITRSGSGAAGGTATASGTSGLTIDLNNGS